MKKSIFLFFAAILCAIGASAATKTIYFKSQQWWHKDNAASAAYYWGTGGNANAWPGTRMTKVEGETNMWSIEIDTDKYQNIIFTRVNGSGNVQDWGAKTEDLVIPTDGNNFFTLSNTEAWNGNKATGSWSTYTPPTEPVIPEYYITGTLAGGWTGNEVKMTYNETTKIHSHTFTAVAAGEEKKFKVTDGTWDANWGGDAVSPAIEGVTKDGDGNAVFTLSTAGDVTITFDGTNIQLTTTGSFTPVETFDYYVVGSFNGWNTADAAYGMTKDGDVYKKEVTFAKDDQFKVCDGTWGAAWGAQNFGDNKYKELDGTDNIVMKEEKTFTIIFNPAQNLLTFEGLTPEAVVTYDYYLIGTINGWATKDENYGMTDENADGVYEKEVTFTANNKHELKINNGSWDDNTQIFGFDQLNVAYEGVSRGSGDGDNNVVIELTEDKTITVKFDKNAGKITLDGLTEKVIEYGVTFKVTVPEGTEACYICGEWDWSTFKPMTPVDDTHYTLTIDNATKDHKYKYTYGEAWAYVEKNADGSDVQDRTWTENDEVAAWANPLATNIYLAGSMTDWANGKIEFMKETPDATIATVAVELPVGDNTFKIIKGETWLGNGGTIENSITGWTFKDGDGDCTLKATYAATYVFTWDLTKEDQQLSVTYPTVETLDYPSVPKTLVQTWRKSYTELDLGNYNTISIYNHDGTDFTYGDDFEVIASLDEVNLEGTGSWKVNGDDEELTATLYNEEKTAIYHITASTKAPKTYTLTCTDAQYAPTTWSTIFSGTADGKALMIEIQMMEVGLNEAFGSCSWDGIEITSTAATVSRDLVENDKYNVTGVFNDAAGNTYDITITGAKPKPAATLNITGATFTEESWGGVVISGKWDTEDFVGSLEGADFGTYESAELYTTTYSHYLSSVGDVTFAQASDGVSVVLTGKFSDMMDATPYDVTITGTLVEFVAPSIELTTGDNATTIDTYAWEIVDATIKRTFVAEDGWYTLCVPFGMDASLIGEAYEITSINKNDKTQGIDVTFSDVDYLWAGYPYLIKPTTTVTDPVIEGVEIEYTTGEEHTVTGDGIKITMTGIINGGGTTNGTTEYYVGANGYLYNQATTKQGLCALFTITDLEGNPTRVRARVVTGENATTGVDDIFTTDVPVKAIVNGQLIIIRGNEKFNAQGQKL